MIEKLQVFHTILNCILISTALLTLLIKPVRTAIFGIKGNRELEKAEKEDRKETDKCLLRKGIMDIYNQYQEKKIIKQYDYENLYLMYKQYKKLGGNSFVDKVWEEVYAEWDVIQ